MPLAEPPPMRLLAEAGPIALFLDFDGTLVGIAPTPDSIVIPERFGAALERCSAQVAGRLALVSGRSLDNLAQHLGVVTVAQAGSHGADCRLADGTRVGELPAALPQVVLDELVEAAERFEGASLEAKSHGAAMHYRARPGLEDLVVARVSEIATRHGLAAKRGKCVIEVLSGTADKGVAVRCFMGNEPFAGAQPVFIGDDVTDEDGFAAVRELGGFGILVGGSRETLACYRLNGPHDVYQWLGLEIT